MNTTPSLSNMKKQLFSEIKAVQAEISDLLRSVADRQDWQPSPDAWSFRYIAAHLATVDKDCHLHRVTRIAAGLEPNFEYYLHDGWNFSYLDLQHALKEWAIIRQVIIDFVDSLPEEALSLTGTHVTFGTMTVLDVLKQMLIHDKEHLEELKELLSNSDWRQSPITNHQSPITNQEGRKTSDDKN